MQNFEPIARRHAQIIDLLCRVDGEKFSSRPALNLIWQSSDRVARKQRSRTFVGKAPDHDSAAYR